MPPASLPASNPKAVHRWTLLQATRQSLKGRGRFAASLRDCRGRRGQGQMAAAIMLNACYGFPQTRPA